MKLKDLRPNPKNPRKITDKKLKMLEKSIKEFGSLDGIIFNRTSGQLEGGHQRQKLSNEEIVIEKTFDKPTKQGTVAVGYVMIEGERFPYREVEWDAARATAANIAANKGAGTFDLGLLSEQFLELDHLNFDMDLTMFDADEIEDLLVDKEVVEPVEGEDNAPGIAKVIHVKPGDLFILGNHRLLCGDATNIQHVEKLMDGKKADMVFTDPPYGIKFQSSWRTCDTKFDVLKNDDTILTEWINVLPLVSSGWVFIWTTWKVIRKWIDATEPFSSMTNMIIWDKGGGGIGDLEKTLSTDYEIALVFNRGAKIVGERIGSVWSVGKDRSKDYIHPTQKPVALSEMAFKSCTKKGDNVLDLFGGSGSTLIACEKTDRKCFMMELDPKYVQVIIERWCKFANEEAYLSMEDGNHRSWSEIKS